MTKCGYECICSRRRKNNRKIPSCLTLWLVLLVWQIPRYILTLHELLAHTPHEHVERNSLDYAKSKLEELSRYITMCLQHTHPWPCVNISTSFLTTHRSSKLLFLKVKNVISAPLLAPTGTAFRLFVWPDWAEHNAKAPVWSRTTVFVQVFDTLKRFSQLYSVLQKLHTSLLRIWITFEDMVLNFVFISILFSFLLDFILSLLVLVFAVSLFYTFSLFCVLVVLVCFMPNLVS